jgi:starch synthase (maltosyl-transferring)
MAPGSEEYLDAEKYEIKHRDLEAAHSLRELITRVNRARRENPALQRDHTLRFHETDNPVLLCYSKATEDLGNVVLVVVNLDPVHTQAGWVQLDLEALGVPPDHAFEVDDLVGDGRYLWQGPRNYIELAPSELPARVLVVRRHIRTERDFDYFT